jgi:hypothetical protein
MQERMLFLPQVAKKPLSRMLENPLSPRLLKKVQMQGGARRAE